MSVYFVGGTGTDVGKTYVTALLARQQVAAGHGVLALKPVASGVPPMQSSAFASTDTAQLLDAQGLKVNAANVEACSPWRFEQPLSPDMAAAAERRSLTLDALADWVRNRIAATPASGAVLIEGVGGVMSPMTSDALNLDLIKILGCPVILVTGSYLGALNHALTALEALKAHKLDVKAVVLNESVGSTVRFEATLDSLRRFAATHPITPLRRDARRVEIDLLGG
ncbi:MAG: dethiobiotin synthase [Gallionella sp.]